MTTRDRDAIIRRAIVPPETIEAPPGLADEIYRSILATPQRRAGIRLGPVSWLPSTTPSVILLILLTLLLVGMALVALSRPALLPPAVSMYHGGPDRTGVMPGPGPIGTPVVAWRAFRSGAIPFTVMPTVAGGRVFIADDSGALAALDETTGAEIWSVEIGSPIRSSPVVVGDLVITGSDDGAVLAIGTGDGIERWRFSASDRVSASLAAVGTEVYIASEDGQLHGLDAASGRELWSLDAGGPINRGPAIADGVIYLGTADGQMMAIDATTHQPLWRRDLSPGGIGTPAVLGGRLYFGHGLERDPAGRELVALDAASGDDVWRFPLGGEFQIHVGAVANDLAYGVSEDSSVYALDRGSGMLRWTFKADGGIGSLAALVDDVLYVAGSDGMVRALDAASGDEHWSFAVDGDPGIPAVINGRVIVGTSFGQVVAIGGSGESP